MRFSTQQKAQRGPPRHQRQVKWIWQIPRLSQSCLATQMRLNHVRHHPAFLLRSSSRSILRFKQRLRCQWDRMSSVTSWTTSATSCVPPSLPFQASSPPSLSLYSAMQEEDGCQIRPRPLVAQSVHLEFHCIFKTNV